MNIVIPPFRPKVRESALRRERRKDQRGFSLAELVITLGVIAILSAIATYSIRRHLALARSAEALQSLGGIARAVTSSYQRDSLKSELLASGKTTSDGNQAPLCDDSVLVPSALNAVTRRKYQPDSSPGKDYMTGDATKGWVCIGYQNSQPQYYQFRYQRGGPPIQLPNGGFPPGIPADRKWNAYARGDVDGDAKLSWFLLYGFIKQQGEMHIATAIEIQDQEE